MLIDLNFKEIILSPKTFRNRISNYKFLNYISQTEINTKKLKRNNFKLIDKS